MASYEYDYKPVSTAPGRPAVIPEKGQLWRQYIFASIANITVILSGFVMGWTSPVNVKLQDVGQSPLPSPVTKDEEAWIGSLLTIGAMCGPFIGGAVASRIGRKWGLVTIAIPLSAGFILIAAANSVAYLYAGRVMWGLAVGMIFTISPMYCVEIATIDARGALGSFLQPYITMGFLAIYAVGPYVSYHVIIYIGLGAIATFISFFFLPESPKYHLMKGNKDAAAASLMTLRGRSRAGVEPELAELTAEIHAAMEKTATLGDLFKGTNFKAFYISCILLFSQQFCGINAVLFDMTNIFEAAGSKMDAAIATILIGAVQVLASVIMCFLVERLGRKMLLLISTSGTAVSLTVLGVYFFLDQQKNPIAEKLGLLPLVSLIVYIFTYCFGLGPMPWTLMSELMPMEVKAVATPIGTAFCWSLSFIVTRYFGPVAVALGMQVVFWVFAVCCLLAFMFTLFVVPETKGKSAMEIQESLAGRSSKAKNELE